MFRVDSADASWVVRFAIDPSRDAEATTEAWALGAAAAAGIPSPAVLASGCLDSVRYLVEEFVPSTSVAERDAWADLGALAGTIGRIPLGEDAPKTLFSRFGRDLPSAWRSHVDYNLGELDETDPLLRAGVYRVEDRDALLAVCRRLRNRPFRFGLAHGDLAPRNLVPRGLAPPVLLDWGSASTGPTPWTDLTIVHAWSVDDGVVSSREFEAFLAAVDLTDEERSGASSTLDDLLILRRLDLARWARERRPELFDDSCQAASASIQGALARNGSA